jgi:hypothetical protein
MRLIDVRSSFTYSDDSITFIGRKLDDNWHIRDGTAYVVWQVGVFLRLTRSPVRL